MILQGVPSGSYLYASSGAYNQPTMTYNDGEGTVTIGAGTYRVFLTPDFTGAIIEFSLPSVTLAISENVESYLCVKYNDGNPTMYFETDKSLTNDSDVLVVYTCSRIGDLTSGFSYLDWNEEAVSIGNKLNERNIDTRRFEREYGLEISVDSNRIVTSTAGSVYMGVKRRFFPEAISNVDECFIRIKDGAGWIRTATPTYPNTQYDSGGSGLVDLTDGQYGVVWIYRDMGTNARIHFIMGRDSYSSVTNAKTAPQPADVDNLMRLDTILVAQVIFLKGQNVPTEINSAFSTVFAPSIATIHNGLGGLQGGHPLEGEFYHLSLETYGYLGTVTSNIQTQIDGKEPTLTKGNLTPGSNKITIGGAGTNAVIGTGVSVDVNPTNILHNDLSTKQGGATNEFNHITNAEYFNYNKLISIITGASKISVYEAGIDNHTISIINTYQKLVIPLTVENKTSDFTVDGINNRLVYTGATTKRFTFNGSASLLNAGLPNMSINFSLFRSGVQLTNTESAYKLDGSTSIGSINASTGFILSQNQYIELFAMADRATTFSTAHLQLLIQEDYAYSYNGV